MCGMSAIIVHMEKIMISFVDLKLRRMFDYN